MRPLGPVQAEYCQQGNTPQPLSSALGGRRRAASACVYLMQSRERASAVLPTVSQKAKGSHFLLDLHFVQSRDGDGG